MPYTWPVDRACLPPLPAEDDETYEQKLAERNNAEDLAVQVLWALSGRQFGVYETVVRPRTLDTHCRPAPYVLSWESGRWIDYPCGCLGCCHITTTRAVHLPGPVAEIVTVTIGADDLDPADYVLEGDVLYRKGGNWPPQDMNRPMGEDQTWSVTYLRGTPPPAGVAVFVGQLANEFIAACSGGSCRLPRNVVATTSRGVSRQFDPSRIYASGKTGLSEIDLWLSAVNPHHLTAPPSVR